MTAIGKNLNIGPFVLSFLLVGLVSALPEGFISVISGFQGVPKLGFGTLIGSVILDLTLVIGLVAVVARKTKVTKGLTYELWLFSLMALLFALAFDGTVSRMDGAILIGGSVLFFYNILQNHHIMDKLVHSDKRHLIKQSMIFAASAAAVFISANFLVKYSQSMAADFGVPLVVIGIILLALATSLPEAVFAITAASKKLADVALGEMFGVIVIDGTLLIGLVAVIRPILLPAAELTKLAVFVLTAIALATYFTRTDKMLTWQEGVFLIMFYILFLFTELTTTAIP
ncbi:sodium:calcium antiporter [Candidatus Woesearchaeota archaeon]|nr:sodium:calcium antiporter [Candidatus Woesearchaeota archaeon]